MPNVMSWSWMFCRYATWCGVRPCRSGRRVISDRRFAVGRLRRLRRRSSIRPSCTSSSVSAVVGRVVEALQQLARASARCAALAGDREVLAAAGDGHVERRLDLPQVLVERRRTGCARRWLSTGSKPDLDAASMRGVEALRALPRSECGSAAVMRDVDEVADQRGRAGESSPRGCCRCVRRARPHPFRDALDQDRWRVPTMRALIALRLLSICACSPAAARASSRAASRPAARRPACRDAGCRGS